MSEDTRGGTPSRDDAGWRVVRNTAGSHSIWPVTRPLPSGWSPVPGVATTARDDALAAVATVWTDDRPAAVGSRP